MAQQYYKKPTAMGGGGNSFVGFETRVPVNLKNTPSGVWNINNGTANDITFSGDPRYYDTWTVEVTVTKDSINAEVTGVTP